jgi:hypothetical protein
MTKRPWDASAKDLVTGAQAADERSSSSPHRPYPPNSSDFAPDVPDLLRLALAAVRTGVGLSAVIFKPRVEEINSSSNLSA